MAHPLQEAVVNPRHELGMRAEAAAAQWLERAGWTIVGRRLRTPVGAEVDLLAVDPRNTLVAVEVRARRSARTGTPEASVDAERLGRLRRSVASLARSRQPPPEGLRVDLVTVAPSQVGPGRWVLRRHAGVAE
jgi:putative endonuclease